MDNILGQEDYFKGYQDNIDKMREEGEHFEFDKKCYEVFKASEAGKDLLDYFMEKIVIAPVPAQINESYANSCIYFEGYREGYRQILHAVKSYPLRKEAEEAAKLRGDK